MQRRPLILCVAVGWLLSACARVCGVGEFFIGSHSDTIAWVRRAAKQLKFILCVLSWAHGSGNYQKRRVHVTSNIHRAYTMPCTISNLTLSCGNVNELRLRTPYISAKLVFTSRADCDRNVGKEGKSLTGFGHKWSRRAIQCGSKLA